MSVILRRGSIYRQTGNTMIYLENARAESRGNVCTAFELVSSVLVCRHLDTLSRYLFIIFFSRAWLFIYRQKTKLINKNNKTNTNVPEYKKPYNHNRPQTPVPAASNLSRPPTKRVSGHTSMMFAVLCFGKCSRYWASAFLRPNPI